MKKDAPKIIAQINKYLGHPGRKMLENINEQHFNISRIVRETKSLKKPMLTLPKITNRKIKLWSIDKRSWNKITNKTCGYRHLRPSTNKKLFRKTYK